MKSYLRFNEVLRTVFTDTDLTMFNEADRPF
jgi:hypothetical protein